MDQEGRARWLKVTGGGDGALPAGGSFWDLQLENSNHRHSTHIHKWTHTRARTYVHTGVFLAHRRWKGMPSSVPSRKNMHTHGTAHTARTPGRMANVFVCDLCALPQTRMHVPAKRPQVPKFCRSTRKCSVRENDFHKQNNRRKIVSSFDS